MVIVSDTVIDVLNRLYLEGIAKNAQIPDFYINAKQELFKLDKRIVTQYSKNYNHCPYNWRINNYPILKVDNYFFSYEDVIEGKERIVKVWEISYKDKILTESISFFHHQLYESIMRDIAKIVKKAILEKSPR